MKGRIGIRSPWRAEARTVILTVIAANPGMDEKALRLAIRAEYPFGERSNYPYKIWCSEVLNQLANRRARARTEEK